MKAFKTTFYSLCILSMLVITSMSCNKDDDAGEITTPAPVTITTIGGRILFNNQLPAAHIKLGCNGVTTTTDSKGFYLFKNISVSANRCVIQLENGFFKTVKPLPGSITYCDIILPSNTNEHLFNSLLGGTIADLSGVSIFFQPSSIQKKDGTIYSGMVKLNIFYFDPTLPINDGINPIHDNRVIIENISKYAFSMGAVHVALKSANGEKLILNPLKPANISIPIAATRLSITPQSVVLVSGDYNAANWKPEGIATKSGNNYITSVSHFSWWNTVVPLGTATISGQVKDISGNPLANATLYENFLGTTTRTDQNGSYTFDVYDGYAYEVSSNINSNMGESAGPYLTPVLGVNQNFSLPDIILQDATIITGNATDCNTNALTTFVIIEDTTGFFNYGIAGSSFSLFAGADKKIRLTATQFNQYNQTDTLAGLAGTILNVGTIQVCTATPAGGNMTITFTSLLTGTHTGTLTMNDAAVFIDTTNGWSYISMTSVDSLAMFGTAFYIVDIYLPVENSYVNSIMPWSIAAGQNWIDPLYMYGESYNSTGFNSFETIGYYDPANIGNTSIVFLGPVGAQISGSFTGPVNINDMSAQTILSGTITGTFNVIRGI